MKQLGWQINENNQHILQVPLHFNFQPVQILSKELTRLNCNSPYRIVYMGARWQYSNIYHKIYSQKHGYHFDINKVNKNNTFFNDSMVNNQYYRNQIYYRAFEGMNPTIQQDQIIFQSRFQSGNLDCVVKVGQNEYDLFLRVDSNTRGHIAWYYFSLQNGKPGQTIKINICNLTKHKSLYNSKLKPYIFTEHPQSSKSKQWSQQGAKNITFQQKRLRYQFIYEKIKVKSLYQLSFQYTFQGESLVKIAYCIPYTYSGLLKQLKQLQKQIQLRFLGKSLTGVDIPLVKIGSDDEQDRKKVVIITGRVHAGQSNGSLMMAGLIKYLCFSSQMQYLRKKIIFLIIPMVNPDGVILGNSRVGASGKDLNRVFKTNSQHLYPQVFLIKKLIKTVSSTNEIEVYFDFHGHSRKKNMFLFGPPYNITQPQYYKCRVFPKILSLVTPIFRYYSCSYSIHQSKKATARAVMLRDYKIPLFYTIQCSLGFFHDYQNHKDVGFTAKIWQKQGENIINAASQYFEAMQQYQKSIEEKKSKFKSPNRVLQLPPNHLQKTIQNNKYDTRIIKLLEQIKNNQQKRENKERQKEFFESDASSDTYNDSQDLQKQQMVEFQSMINNYIEYQVPSSKNIIFQKKMQQNRSLNQNLIKKRNKIAISKRQEMALLNQMINQKHSLSPQSRINIKSHRYNRIKQPPFKNQSQNKLKKSQQQKKYKKPQSIYEYTTILQQNMFQEKVIRRFKNKSFNQKLNEQTLVLPLQVKQRQFDKPKKIKNKKTPIFQINKILETPRLIHFESNEDRYQSLDYQKSDTLLPYLPQRFNKITLFGSEIIDNFQQNEDQIKKNEQQRYLKSKNPFPASFYRIKYQVSKINKQKQTKEEKLQRSESVEKTDKSLFLTIQKIINK